MTDSEFPVAEISDRKQPWWTTLSRMWIVTLACLVFAIVLAWTAMDSPGTEIVIRFDEGHGLKPGDALRHRGIDIGHVESVELNPKFSGIQVRAVLGVNAEGIARNGSRFWIVRPRLDVTGVSGLETAVGAKYIRVLPGNSTEKQTDFDGLNSQPPSGIRDGGIEIIVRGDDRYGVNPGSPLTWRGVEVGQVLSSSLSPDALHVDTRIRVLESYRRLLSRDSKFWVTSGIHMGLDMTGFELSTESLSTIARGGIAFITPTTSPNRSDVKPGDVFPLHEEADDKWIDSAGAVNLMELDAPPVAAVLGSWTQKHFGIPRSHEAHASALTIATGQGASVYVPADLVEPPEAIQDSYRLVYQSDSTEHISLNTSKGKTHAGIMAITLEDEQVNAGSLLSPDRVRSPEGPEDCFVVRRSWQSGSESTVVIEMIGQHQLIDDGEVWRCTNAKLSRGTWHGAAVVSNEDEKVIGMLVVSEDGPVIAPLLVP